MSNMTPEELREHISKEMGWWAPGSGLSKDIGDGFDAYPQRTEKVIQLSTYLCGEVIGDMESNNYGGLDYSNKKDFRNALRSEQCTRLTKLTGKEMNQ